MNWGGRRKGAGRPKKKDSGVSHRARPKVAKSYPVFVTQRVKGGLPNLRFRKQREVIELCLTDHNEQWEETFRVIDYVIIGNHFHLLVEVRDKDALSRGMQGLLIRIARRLNTLWNRSGSIFRDRYHARILKSPREVRNRLNYLYNNARKHGYKLSSSQADPCSSGPWFDGWRKRPTNAQRRRVTAAPRTWLRSVGWRRSGLLLTTDVPGQLAM